MRKHTLWFAAVAILSLGPLNLAVLAQNTVQTIAGGGPNNLPALKSSLGSPASVSLDGTGNIYLADPYHGRVLRVDPTGNVAVVAGNGARGGFFNGDGGPAISTALAFPSGAVADRLGNVFIPERSFCSIRKVSALTGIVSTIAGTRTCGYSGDGGPATSAMLNDPSGVAVDNSGNVFIADTLNCLIREISASTGVISTVAGIPPDLTGLLHCGYAGDGGLSTGAKVGFANSVAVDGFGNVFIADTTNCAIRKISAANGVISTVAGTVSCGYSGDGGLATGAQLSTPNGVAVDSSGNVFIADTSNCVIRMVSSSTSRISTVAGNFILGCGYSGDGALAISAQLNQPYGVAVDNSGNTFVADFNNSVIRSVSASTGTISTFAGVTVPDPNHLNKLIGLPMYSGDGYPAPNAELGFLNNTPYGAGLATDRAGNIYFADTANNAVRKISASTGIITTVAGNGLIGFSGDGGPATDSQLFYPRDVSVDASDNIFIMDSGNCVVRKISASTGIISTVAGTVPESSGIYHCDFSGDGGPATSAQLYPIDLLTPAGGVTVDSSGNIFIADTGNNAIRKVSASTGIIDTVAGIPCFSVCFVGGGDGGPATSANLFSPYGVAVDGVGNIFIADTSDFAVREVMALNGNIYTVAGNIPLGNGFSGDGGPAGAAQIRNVFGSLFLDAAGNLFIPDPANCVIRKVSGSTGMISTAAGTPNPTGDYFCGYSGDGGPALSAIFDNPAAVGGDASGNLVVLDNIRIRTVANLLQGPSSSAVPFPSPLVFPDESLQTSNTLTVMLSNRGSLPTSVSTLAISGVNASDFSETDNCAGRSLSPSGGSCAINVKFAPSVAAKESALLTITDAAGTQNVELTGTGLVPPRFSTSVPAISFGNQLKSVKSTSMNVTVTNNGGSNLAITSVAISGPNAGDFAISGENCSVGPLAVNAGCGVNVTFTPRTTSLETASLQFTDNAPGSPHIIGLTGTGTDFSMGVAPGGSSTATVPAGGQATYNLQVSPVSGFNGTVALSCTGAPVDSTCLPSQASATLNGNSAALFSVQVTTTAPSAVVSGGGRQWRPFDGLRILPTALLISLALVLLGFASRFRNPEAEARSLCDCTISLGFLLFAVILAGCSGGGSPSGGPPSGGTPIGTYTLTLTATSGGSSHTTQLTLTVSAAH